MYPKPYIEYLVYFHGNHDYFECHEVLEEYWKESEREQHWVGFIQLAVSLYHYRRNNLNGAIRMLKSALAILQAEQVAIQKLGLDTISLFALLSETLKKMETGAPYRNIQLPIQDNALETLCINLCHSYSFPWRHEDQQDAFLLHKHMLRDRTDVIAKRMAQMQKRQR